MLMDIVEVENMMGAIKKGEGKNRGKEKQRKVGEKIISIWTGE